jgi:hypothetical protein
LKREFKETICVTISGYGHLFDPLTDRSGLQTHIDSYRLVRVLLARPAIALDLFSRNRGQRKLRSRRQWLVATDARALFIKRHNFIHYRSRFRKENGPLWPYSSLQILNPPRYLIERNRMNARVN